ncbi:MAG TPA: GDSL-type esterase/lipase family protein [bacterium]|nr:GDSL-type esterase/lipase family protein [bacterium]
MQRITLSAAALIISLLVAEATLRVAGVEPRVAHGVKYGLDYKPALVTSPPPGVPYLIKPYTELRESWAESPAGYSAAPGNSLVYSFNNFGFRGPDFSLERTDKVRIAFIGDSFCFGQGVRTEDIITVRLEEYLSRAPLFLGRFEVYNFGLPGYDSSAELALFKEYVLNFKPDVCVVWYLLNDVQMDVKYMSMLYLGGNKLLKRYRSYSRLLDFTVAPIDWWIGEKRLTQTYLAAYQDGSPDFQRVKKNLAEFARCCRENHVLPVLAIHPVLMELNENHPFLIIHEKIGAAARSQGIEVVDLFPCFRGLDENSLWVAPTDCHPNHLAHRMIAEKFGRELLAIMAGKKDYIAESRRRKSAINGAAPD